MHHRFVFMVVVGFGEGSSSPDSGEIVVGPVLWFGLFITTWSIFTLLKLAQAKSSRPRLVQCTLTSLKWILDFHGMR
jgi:hypothetical protein